MELKIPMSIAQKRDLLILYREAERLSEQMLQQRVALNTAQAHRDLPMFSSQLMQLFESNNIEATEANLQMVLEALHNIYKIAPQVRISFASEPDQKALEKIVEWFRREADPNTFLLIGIQPMLAGGCVVRTPHNRYDFSLRRQFMEHAGKLMEAFDHAG